MWVLVKVVGAQSIDAVGAIVGPFATALDAQDYAERLKPGALGYEAWLVREVQLPRLPYDNKDLIDSLKYSFWKRGVVRSSRTIQTSFW
jgi:hypothetical protein